MEIKSTQNKIELFKKIKKNRCPSCKQVSLEPYIPFCSKKCSDIDLMKWLSDEVYIKDKDGIK